MKAQIIKIEASDIEEAEVRDNKDHSCARHVHRPWNLACIPAADVDPFLM